MNPADYILPPESVKARFPAELLRTGDAQAIIDACIERLEIPQSSEVLPRSAVVRAPVDIKIVNTDGDDFRDNHVTLTVSRRVSRTRIETAMHLTESGVVSTEAIQRALRYA